MYVTEEEASSRWCPMVRAAATWAGENRKIELAVGGINTPPGDRAAKSTMATCIGSRRMMWRLKSASVATGSGYCGLAGTPAPQVSLR